MRDLKLLSNGKYHVLLTDSGSGQSHWGDVAITRRREDAALDAYGSFLYFRDSDSDAVWSMGAQPTLAGVDAHATELAADAPAFTTGCAEIVTACRVAVAAHDDVELRRVRITNHSDRPRRLTATSLTELVLAPQATDSAHPAFNKLFVVTEIERGLGAVLATRRAGKPSDPAVWVFHQATVSGAGIGRASYETDRMRFIGRGRSIVSPQALHDDAALSDTAGPVLDPVAAIRLPVSLEPGQSCTLDWFTGAAPSREECLALARKYHAAGAGDAVLAEAGTYRRSLLEQLGASEDDGRLFEQLAAALLYSGAALRAPAETIAANDRGQSSLWAFGISGDAPIVLLEAGSAASCAAARQLAQAQSFWTAHGLKSELLIAAGPAEAADPALAERLRGAIAEGGGGERLDKPGGIFLRNLAAIGEGDRTLLRAAARIVLAGPGSLAEQAERGSAAEAPAALRRQSITATTTSSAAGSRGAELPPQLLAANGHGGFSADGSEYVIATSAAHPTPLPWTNVIANPQFGTLVSESGSATSWSENAHEFRLTPWWNDPVSDATTEAIYLRDEGSGRFWSPTLLPTRSSLPYLVRHGFGYSVFEHAEAGIASTLCVHVDAEAALKYSTLTLKNTSAEPKRISVTGIVDWVLGDERAKNLMHIVSERDPATGTIYARNAYNTDFAGRQAFFDIDAGAGANASGVAELSATADRADFYGTAGTPAAPQAMFDARLSGRFGAGLDPCAALRVAIDLSAGEEREVVFRLGAAKTPAAARELVERTRGAEAARRSLAAVRAGWAARLGAVQVHTPDATADALANGWLLYQVISSRLWGRTGFYQSSGAYGFRDQLQDVMALVHAEPGLVREHLLRAAARQFPEGDVQHWWHPPSGKGVRTRCSDDYLWLPLVAARYVDVTGDAAVLDEACPFIDSRQLLAGEQSNYDLPKVSEQSAPLYEHCRRAIRHGFRYGAHGLPLMGMGDWNDGMDQVGAEGKGESVWLAFFLITVLDRFAPIAAQRGDAEFAAQCSSEAAGLRERAEASAWDGAWYQRAWFDDGSPLGTAANAECRIDSIAQSWSVLSGAASPERARMAMDSVHAMLVKPETRIIQLLDPPFDTAKPSPGYIAGYVPGVRENGGQYTHGATWTALAFAALGQSERAWASFSMLDPTKHADSPAGIARYKTEPYVMAGDVYAFAPHAGRGGWTWYTGSAGWMYQLLVESLLGLQRHGDRLEIHPLLPAAWSGFEMRYRFGSATYEISCRAAASAGEAGLAIDGRAAGDGHVHLADDGQRHAVVVSVWRDPAALAR